MSAVFSGSRSLCHVPYGKEIHILNSYFLAILKTVRFEILGRTVRVIQAFHISPNSPKFLLTFRIFLEDACGLFFGGFVVAWKNCQGMIS